MKHPLPTLRVLAFGLSLVLGGVLSRADAGDPTRVGIETGPISGVLLDKQAGLCVYRGIPYAAPPTGRLRWRPPEKAANWKPIRSCDKFGPACFQSLRNGSSQLMSEDYLYLNVWTTKAGTKARLPVMVWIHGGGLNMGWGHQGTYDGSAFARQGVVLVSINYRLGPFGFLAHPELSAESKRGVSGNYGFLDQVFALQWVKRNISAFGGDPGNVTIFGESAGGTSVSVLCASQLARGLFHRAILQSPWMFGYINNLAEPNHVYLKKRSPGAASAETLGLEWGKLYSVEKTGGSLEALRAVEAKRMVKDAPYYKTRATIDGWVLDERPGKIFAKGRQANVPVLIGTTSDEGNYFLGWIRFGTREEFTRRLKSFYGTDAAEVALLYPGESKSEVRAAASRFVTDSWFVQPARELLRGMEKVSAPAFQYNFTRTSQSYPALGAPHAIELAYVFNTLKAGRAGKDGRELARKIMKYWVQFAETGNPNAEGLPAWPEYDSKKTSYLELGDELKTGAELGKRTCDALDRFTSRAYSAVEAKD